MFRKQDKNPKCTSKKSCHSKNQNSPATMIACAAAVGALFGSISTIVLGPFAKKTAQAAAAKVQSKFQSVVVTPELLDEMIDVADDADVTTADDFGYSADLDSEK